MGVNENEQELLAMNRNNVPATHHGVLPLSIPFRVEEIQLVSSNLFGRFDERTLNVRSKLAAMATPRFCGRAG